MKKILIAVSLVMLSISSFAQTEIVRDYIDATKELTVRDTSIVDLIQQHTSGSSVGASNALTKVGSTIELGGAFSKNTEIVGLGYSLDLGIDQSRLDNFTIYSNSGIGLISYDDIIINAHGVQWTLIGDYWISSNGDTLATKQDIQTLINANAPLLPFNLKYTFSSDITNTRPGSGVFKLNNGVLQNATKILIDYYDNNNKVKSNFLAQLDTGSVITLLSDENNYVIYELTGAKIDEGNYFTYNVSYKAHNGVISGLSVVDFDLVGSGGSNGGSSSPDSLLINATDTIVFKGDTLFADKANIRAKTGYFNDSIWIANGWITGVDKSDNLKIDSVTTILGTFDTVQFSDGTFQVTAGGDGAADSLLVSSTDTVTLSGGVLEANYIKGKEVEVVRIIIDTVVGHWDKLVIDGGSDLNITSSHFIDIISDDNFLIESTNRGVDVLAKELLRLKGQGEIQINSDAKIHVESASSRYIYNNDSLRADGTQTSSANNALFKNFFARAGGFFGRIFEGDTARFRNLSIGGSAYVDTVIDISGLILTGKSYSFTSYGVPSGTFWRGGFYSFSETDANLDESNLTQSYGVSDIAYSAHAGIVFGSGEVTSGSGRVAIIAKGTSINDHGVRVVNDVDTILTDITQGVLNTYYEAKKYLGTVSFELAVVNGAPTVYNADFNYGYAKYEDFGNRNFTLIDSECMWRGNALDATGFDITLFKHSSVGWLYAASGFEAGGSVIAKRSIDQVGYLRVQNDVDATWKRTDLNKIIHGAEREGLVFQIKTGTNGTVQIMDMHLEIILTP